MVNRMNLIKPFGSGHTRALLVTGFLALAITLDLIGGVSELPKIGVLRQLAAGQTTTNVAVAASATRQAIIGIAQMIVSIITAILFLIWIHRAHRNLPALGAQQLEFTPSWAVGWFFVPFANLFMPYRTIKEIWKASDPNVDIGDGAAWQNAPVSPLIGFWWACWIISPVIGLITFSVSLTAETVPELLVASWMTLSAHLPNVLTAGLLILLIRAIDTRQAERHRRLTSHIVRSSLPPLDVRTEESLALYIRTY